MASRVLVVDDEKGMLEVCGDTLDLLPDVEVVLEQRSARAAALLAQEPFDLLITDIRMPGMDGVDLLRVAREHDPTLPALILTAYPTVETAVEAMKLGAADYLGKPFRPEELQKLAKRLLDERRLRDENRLLSRQVERAHLFDEIVGRSAAMQKVFELIQRVAATDADVLILGETGTGKELVARSLHGRSQRKGQRFVPVDCGAIPDNLLESELFGHERGAFTGADSRSLGLLEYATRGTFFLDEVAELPPRLQSKLLRVLQERRVRRVGGKDEVEVDVRVIAATSRDLDEEMREHRFREDLYYRINVARIELPPLRQRSEDIPLLVAHFFGRYAEQMGKPGIQLDSESLEILCRYSWPGNVRELSNVLRRALTMARGDSIVADDLPDPVVAQAGAPASVSSKGTRGSFFDQRTDRIEAFEREYLTGLLLRTKGDVNQAAADAQLPRGTLYRLLKKYSLAPADFRS
jgi:DNA-binding NtrC family response regulator